MPSLSEHTSNRLTKVMIIGDSGTGKTGSTLSLAKAGYKLRFIDLDNGLDSLAALAKRECPDKLGNIEYETLRDKVKSGPAGISSVGVPQAFVKAVGLMDKWTDGSRPADWGPEYVLVIDSLTFLAAAAFAWKEALNPAVKDRRQIYGAAQEAVEDVLALLTSPDFNTNLVVISHVRWISRPDGSMKGYPSAVGEALSPKIGTYFNSVALTESTGTGDKVRRTIRTAPTQLIDLKNPASINMAPQLPIETGLADFFKTLQSKPA